MKSESAIHNIFYIRFNKSLEIIELFVPTKDAYVF